MSTAGLSAKDALLQRCLAFLAEDGFSHLSLREIAAGVGTSHRMLIYHFGSREGLLAAVVGQVEAAQREALAQLAADGAVDVGRAFWRRVADPALAPAERLFFEIYAQALYRREWTEEFRAAVIDAWVGPVEELFVHLGFSPAEARRRTRLGLATTRGLLLDLLLTGDRQLLDEAADLFGDLLTEGGSTAEGVGRPKPEGGRRRSSRAGPASRSRQG